MELTGVVVPIVTIFSEDGASIEYGSIEEHADYLIGAGVNAIIPNGTTGDFFSLTKEEKKSVAEKVVKKVRNRVTVFVGTTSLTTKECIEMSKHAEQIGADGVMIAPPFYMPLTQDAVCEHYEMVSKAISIPILVYNNPLCTGQNVTPDMLKRLHESAGIKYVKDSTGSLTVDTIQNIIWKTKGAVKTFDGEEHLAMQSLLEGAEGLVMGHANGLPDYFVKLVKHIKNGRVDEAKKMHYNMFPLWDFTNKYDKYIYNSVVKSVMKLCGRGNVTHTRRPIVPLNGEQEALLRGILVKVGVV